MHALLQWRNEQGLTDQDIADRLNAMGARLRNGKPLTFRSVQDICYRQSRPDLALADHIEMLTKGRVTVRRLAEEPLSPYRQRAKRESVVPRRRRGRVAGSKAAAPGRSRKVARAS